MYLSESVQLRLRRFIGKLYSARLDTKAIIDAAPVICDAMKSHYFALNRFSDHRPGNAILFSNNPPEFLDVYSQVYDKDFIMSDLVENQKTVSLRAIPGWDSRENFAFSKPVQNTRPISDVIYVPARVGGCLAGYWAIGRAGLNSPIYNEADFKTFEFISAFLTDAVRRSFAAVPEIDDIAHLDSGGNVLFSGNRIGASFMELFGPSGRDCPCRGETPAGLAFRERFTGFVHGLCCPANSRFFWENETGRRWEFSFQLQRSSSEPRRFKDRSVVLVTQVPNEHSEAESVFPARSLLEGYGLTDREVDVVREVYRGRSNKDIADLFRIAEPTVKSHLGSVYEKTGSASRTALLFKLSL